MDKRVKCPTCGTPISWEGNPNRPFCSERCQAIDLGKWAEEEYKIPGQAAIIPDQPNEYEN